VQNSETAANNAAIMIFLNICELSL
jgi:hypothetical protein